MIIYFSLILIAIIGTVMGLFKNDDKTTMIFLVIDCILALPIVALAFVILTMIIIY